MRQSKLIPAVAAAVIVGSVLGIVHYNVPVTAPQPAAVPVTTFATLTVRPSAAERREAALLPASLVSPAVAGDDIGATPAPDLLMPYYRFSPVAGRASAE